jgi:hypothetical protein
MKRWAVPYLLLWGLLAGCRPEWPGWLGNSPSPRPDPKAASPSPQPPDANQPRKPGQYVFVVRLRLVTIEVPAGTASRSEEIWSYLDEEPVQAIRSVNLGRNGLRVGRGRADTWPDLARIFKRMTGRSPKQTLLVAIPGDPLPIVLKERQAAQTIFTFYDDRTLSGADYPPGDNVLATVCTLDEDDVSRIMVTIVPQIRTTHRKTRFVLDGGEPKKVAAPMTYSFPQLAFQLTVPSKDFLVIGPGAHARRPTSVGNHFLVREKEGVEFESLLVLIPEAFAAPMRRAARAAP